MKWEGPIKAKYIKYNGNGFFLLFQVFKYVFIKKEIVYQLYLVRYTINHDESRKIHNLFNLKVMH